MPVYPSAGTCHQHNMVATRRDKSEGGVVVHSDFIPLTIQRPRSYNVFAMVGYVSMSSMELVNLMKSGTFSHCPFIAGTWNGSCGQLRHRFHSAPPISLSLWWLSFTCFLHSFSLPDAKSVLVLFSIRQKRITKMNLPSLPPLLGGLPCNLP